MLPASKLHATPQSGAVSGPLIDVREVSDVERIGSCTIVAIIGGVLAAVSLLLGLIAVKANKITSAIHVTRLRNSNVTSTPLYHSDTEDMSL